MHVPKFTVAVCTYNRADCLLDLLESLLLQRLAATEFEIIIIDNNSTDGTKTLAARYCRTNRHIKYFFEPRQGLSHARNRAMAEAAGEYIAYIDDDGKAPEDWLEIAVDLIEKEGPSVFGGPYYGYFKTQRPPWFRESYGSKEMRANAGPMDPPNSSLSGGNLFIKTSLLKKMGGFLPEYGMSGDKLGYGEETELQQRIRNLEGTEIIYYEPRLYIYHLVRSEKMKLRWWFFHNFERGQTEGRLRKNDFSSSLRQRVAFLVNAIRHFVLLLGKVLAGLIRRDRSKFPYIQNLLIEKIFWHVNKAGFFLQLTRNQ